MKDKIIFETEDLRVQSDDSDEEIFTYKGRPRQQSTSSASSSSSKPESCLSSSYSSESSESSQASETSEAVSEADKNSAKDDKEEKSVEEKNEEEKDESTKKEENEKKQEVDVDQLTEELEGLMVGAKKPEGLCEMMDKIKIIQEAKDDEIKDRKPMWEKDLGQFNPGDFEEAYEDAYEDNPLAAVFNQENNDNQRAANLLNGGNIVPQPIFSENDIAALHRVAHYFAENNLSTQYPNPNQNLNPIPTPTMSPPLSTSPSTSTSLSLPSTSHQYQPYSPGSDYAYAPSPSSGYISSDSLLASRSPMYSEPGSSRSPMYSEAGSSREDGLAGLELDVDGAGVLIPSTVSQSSDEEEMGQRERDAVQDVMKWSYSKQMEKYKMYDFIRAADTKVNEMLFQELRHLIRAERKLTALKFLKIYHNIGEILRRKLDLRSFLCEPNLLSHVARHNIPLLFRYMVKTIQNAGLNPAGLGESASDILEAVINPRNGQDPNTDRSELLRTVLSLRNPDNSPMFNLNVPDRQGFTTLHKILMMMSTQPELAMRYFKICLEFQPDFTVMTLSDSRTYMHHAILWGVPPLVMDDILNYSYNHHSHFNILNIRDHESRTPLDIAQNLPYTYIRNAILEVLQRYNNSNPTIDDDPLSDYFNNYLSDDL